ncbi:glycosyltransferase [Vibrio splendidus]
MKVCHIIINLNIGGAELMLKRLVERENNHKHLVVTLLDGGVLKDTLTDSGVKVYSLNIRRLIDLPGKFILLCRILRTHNVNVVQTWMYHSDIFGGIAGKVCGIKKIIWNVRNTDLQGRGKINTLFRKICGLCSYFLPNKVIYVSNSARKSHEYSGYDKSKGKVIYNGFDLDKYSFSQANRKEYREKIEVNNDDYLIFSVGRFTKAKDHITFIDMIIKLRQVNPSVKGVLVGRGLSNCNEKIMHMIGNEIGGFILLGERGDISSLLCSADLFCLHSRTEGFPNVLGEAMSIGLPCVTTKAGDAEFILGDNRFTATVGSVDDLESTVTRMKSLTISERKEIGCNNRNRVVRLFELSKIIDEYSHLYEGSEV